MKKRLFEHPSWNSASSIDPKFVYRDRACYFRAQSYLPDSNGPLSQLEEADQIEEGLPTTTVESVPGEYGVLYDIKSQFLYLKGVRQFYQ